MIENGIYQWIVYLEKADSDEEKREIGKIRANSQAEALKKACEFYEVPSHDLVVERFQGNAFFH